jgi:ethanolamine ammonia-lyase small subunit
MEDSIRDIVEKVIVEINKKQEPAVENARPVQSQPVVEADALCDLSTIDLQRHLQVPNPVNRKNYEEMKLSTPARIGVWRCGPRPLTSTLLRFRADHAVAQDSVLGEVPAEFTARMNMVAVKTMCRDKDEHLTRPDLGRKLGSDALEQIRKACPQGTQVQIIVSDGLSSKAVETNAPDLLPALIQGLGSLGVKCGPIVFVKYGRVAVMDPIGDELKPEVGVILIGERPGLGTAESLSAYIGYRPRAGMLESERTVLSNIHKGGTPAAEAGAHLATLIKRILDAKASGVKLEA